MTAPTMSIEEPGVYDIPVEAYHTDPVPGGSLSSTGARKLLPPSCPALFKHWRDAGQPERKREFDLGHAAHRLVLGAGQDLVVVEAANYRTNAAKDARDDAYAADKIPILPHELEAVQEMAAALFAHPFAGKLFTPGTGAPEQTIVWRDEQTGVWCRSLLDWLPDATGGRVIVRDYKTAPEGGASPDRLPRTIAGFGYHVQLAFQRAAVRAVGRAGDDAQAVLVVQERTPPYLVTVAEPDPPAMRLGEIRMREALRVYAECAAADRWRGYADDVVQVELPPWETRELNGEVW